jgi:hypothetical protein
LKTYWATPATTAIPATRGALKPVGSAPEEAVAEATADEAEALILLTFEATELGLGLAEDALSMALEAPLVMEATTDETDEAID